MLNRKFSRALVLAGSSASLGALPGLGQAAGYANGSSASSFNATLQVVDNCVIAAYRLDSGQGGPANAAPVDTTINVTCSHATLYNVGLNNGGAATSAGATTRYTSASGATVDTVRFRLAQSARAISRANSVGSITLSGAGSGLSHLLSMYRQISAQVTPRQVMPRYKPTVTAIVYF